MGPGSVEYSERVMQSYMCCYANSSRLGRPVTKQDIARIHNGGPNGYKKFSTISYWVKVRSYLKNQERKYTTPCNITIEG